MNLRDFRSAKERREAVEKELELNLAHIGLFSFREEQVAGRNIENLIGAAQIPLGIAGPLQIMSSRANARDLEDPERSRRAHQEISLRQLADRNDKHEFYIPLATTEGALVASVNRGCKAITESGGANVYSYRVGTTRGPVFFTGSIEKSKKLYEWMKNNEKLLKKTAESTSSHLTYKKALVRSMADHVFVRFSFDTGDAMGMNMVTIATEKIAELIEKKTGTTCLSIAGNFDIDKKPSWMNFINNRGHKAWAEVKIPKRVLSDILKTTAQKLFDVWYAKCMLGSAMSGSLGFNAHFANVIAAIFLATGQDPAHVVEGSHGITTMRILKNGDLYVSVYLPALMLGTVGGGTGLPTQQEALKILGVSGAGKVEKFAEIIAGAVLAGEISLLASLSAGTLGTAHERLGRKNVKSQTSNGKSTSKI